MTASPLVAGSDLERPIAWRGGKPISAARFVGEAERLAERLPGRGDPVNLCRDRYAFALGFAAALMRGQTSLLPPNALPETLRSLRASHAQPYALLDDAGIDAGGLHTVQVTLAPTSALPQREREPLRRVPSIAGDLVASCMLTSGSTGAPQPHARRWADWVVNIGAEAERLASLLGVPSLAGFGLVATVPPQHSYGFESSVLLALLGGAALENGRPFYPADIAAALDALPRPRALVTTPFHLNALLQSALELPRCDLVLCATAPLSPQLAAHAERALGAPLIEIYGCTEAGQVATRRTTDGDVWHALGALHLSRRGAGAAERFYVEGGHVPEPTALADVLQLEDAQRFRLLGRANDLIHVAGKRSSLAHLNYHLSRIEGVRDAAFWLPDDVTDGVVRPIALVVAPGLKRAQIIAALRTSLDAAFVPRRVVFVDALPRDATGKLGAEVLRRFALERLS